MSSLFKTLLPKTLIKSSRSKVRDEGNYTELQKQLERLELKEQEIPLLLNKYLTSHYKIDISVIKSLIDIDKFSNNKIKKILLYLFKITNQKKFKKYMIIINYLITVIINKKLIIIKENETYNSIAVTKFIKNYREKAFKDLAFDSSGNEEQALGIFDNIKIFKTIFKLLINFDDNSDIKEESKVYNSISLEKELALDNMDFEEELRKENRKNKERKSFIGRTASDSRRKYSSLDMMGGKNNKKKKNKNKKKIINKK